MAKQFPGAGKRKGGPKVILSFLISCYASPAENAVLQNSIPDIKKKLSQFYRRIFPGVCSTIAGQNRFARQENSSNTRGTRLLPRPRNTRRKGASVTTRHVFWPTQRRKAGLLLPSWLRNLDFLGAECSGGTEGGRGGSATRNRRKLRTDKLSRKFYAQWIPYRAFGARKKKPRLLGDCEDACAGNEQILA